MSDLATRTKPRPADVVPDMERPIPGVGGMYSYRGAMHMAPESFRFPSYCVESLWSNWFLGQATPDAIGRFR